MFHLVQVLHIIEYILGLKSEKWQKVERFRMKSGNEYFQNPQDNFDWNT